MAKKSLILKNIYIYKNSLLNKNKIKILKKKIIGNFSLEKYFKIFNIKKKNFFVRFKNRCFISGRNRSCYSRFSLNRNFIRKIGYTGNIIGLEKSSW
ncbi:MAG: hypothetical protein NVS86_00945 [Candidatus Carsonella ruddii]|nr:MAG: hypothetical protein NVS86_00945 [Candidatus Carsonella ruddii]